MAIVFFKRDKPKQFDFKNRYYDPDQEARDRRRRKMEARKEGTYDPEGLREEMRYRWNLSRESNLQFNTRYTNFRRMLILVLIAAVLIAAMYFMGLYIVENS